MTLLARTGIVNTYTQPFSATGGTTTDSGGYRYHTFNASGSFVTTGSKSMNILVVGGGSGGGSADGSKNSSYAGPGGGAGLFTTVTRTISGGTYPVTIGAGGGAVGYPSLFNFTDASALTYAVGDTGPAGGKIFMTPSTSGNSTGLYFEVAPAASEVSRTWAQSSLQGTRVVGARFFEIGTGTSITPLIVAQGNSSDATCAATYCDNYTYGGYSDWFLPSLTEMQTLYSNRVAVNSSISTTTAYWTCSEDTLQLSSATYGRVWAAGSSNSVLGKNNSRLVRPVRAFSASAFAPIYAVGGSPTSSSAITAGGNSVFEGGLEYSFDIPTSSGGGGTSAVGQNPYYTSPNYYSGNGGAGSSWNSFKFFGGGGGAGGYYSTGFSTIANQGAGGTTGGGAGSNPTLATPISGENGTANTGGGGGGGSFKNYSITGGGNGGSGVVIVRYLL